jgi:DNA-binding XRE family transcriptional regulator
MISDQEKQKRLKSWKRERQRLGITVSSLAKFWGLNQKTLYNWNCGNQPIPKDRLKQLEAMK